MNIWLNLESPGAGIDLSSKSNTEVGSFQHWAIIVNGVEQTRPGAWLGSRNTVFVFLLCLGKFFLRLNRKDQVLMLAVEISRCALVSHRGADSRHDSPTELGGVEEWGGGEEGGLIGHQTNMNNSGFEMDLVYPALPASIF